MLRLWFNRTYATTGHLIGMLRANPQQRAVHVIGSHVDPHSPVLAACDEYFLEPELDADAYVQWALGVAEARAVDLLVPRRHHQALSAHRAEFAALGTRVLAAEPAAIALFDDKDRAYRQALQDGLPVPPYRVVCDGAALRAAYAEMAVLSEQVCMKPVRGAGGEGYRRLTDRPLSWADFAGPLRTRSNLDAVARALDAEPAPPPVLVMPYLDGDEVSVDVVARADGAVHTTVGRRHLPGRRRMIVDDPDATAVATALTERHRVGYLSNTQVRYWQAPDDTRPRPYLLELNTRAAGGLFQTELAGVNLPWLAVRLALGEQPEPVTPRFGAEYTEVAGYARLLPG